MPRRNYDNIFDRNDVVQEEFSTEQLYHLLDLVELYNKPDEYLRKRGLQRENIQRELYDMFQFLLYKPFQESIASIAQNVLQREVDEEISKNPDMVVDMLRHHFANYRYSSTSSVFSVLCQTLEFMNMMKEIPGSINESDVHEHVDRYTEEVLRLLLKYKSDGQQNNQPTTTRRYPERYGTYTYADDVEEILFNNDNPDREE